MKVPFHSRGIFFFFYTSLRYLFVEVVVLGQKLQLCKFELCLSKLVFINDASIKAARS